MYQALSAHGHQLDDIGRIIFETYETMADYPKWFLSIVGHFKYCKKFENFGCFEYLEFYLRISTLGGFVISLDISDFKRHVFLPSISSELPIISTLIRKGLPIGGIL